MDYTYSTRLKRIFAISVFLTLAWMIVMGLSVKPLNSKQIVSFELAKTPEAASKIIKEWEENDLIIKVKKSIYLDFGFLFLYSLSIALGCLVISAFTRNHFLIQTGSVVSLIVPFAGLFDVIENLAMLKTLSGEVTMLPVAITFWFASIKFFIVVVSLVFVISCLIFGVVKRIVGK